MNQGKRKAQVCRWVRPLQSDEPMTSRKGKSNLMDKRATTSFVVATGSHSSEGHRLRPTERGEPLGLGENKFARKKRRAHFRSIKGSLGVPFT